MKFTSALITVASVMSTVSAASIWELDLWTDNTAQTRSYIAKSTGPTVCFNLPTANQTGKYFFFLSNSSLATVSLYKDLNCQARHTTTSGGLAYTILGDTVKSYIVSDI